MVSLVLVLAGCIRSGSAGECPPGVENAARAVAALHGARAFPVRCETVEPEAMIERLRQQLESSLPVGLETELEVAWRLGLTGGKRPSEVEGPLLRLLGSQVLGYYDPGSDTVVLASGSGGGGVPAGMGTMVWAHEVEHAWQERRYGLGTRMLELKGDTDAQLAASAVAEGDAVLVMVAVALAAEKPTPADLADAAPAIVDALGMVSGAVGDGDVPRVFVEQLLFPYREGTALVGTTLRRAGWEGVDALLREPPASTEQLLHEDRRTDEPTRLGPSDLPDAPGWKTVMTDVTGEWGFVLWLGMALPEDEARRAAAGWDGDLTRVSRSRTDPDRWRVDLVSVWDTEGDAAEAAAAFREAFPEMFRLGPGGSEVRVRRTGGRVLVEAVGLQPPPPAGDLSAVPSSRDGTHGFGARSPEPSTGR